MREGPVLRTVDLPKINNVRLSRVGELLRNEKKTMFHFVTSDCAETHGCRHHHPRVMSQRAQVSLIGKVRTRTDMLVPGLHKATV